MVDGENMSAKTVQKEALSDLERTINVCDGYNFGRTNYTLGLWVEGMTLEDSKRRGELLDRFADECVCRKKRE